MPTPNLFAPPPKSFAEQLKAFEDPSLFLQIIYLYLNKKDSNKEEEAINRSPDEKFIEILKHLENLVDNPTSQTSSQKQVEEELVKYNIFEYFLLIYAPSQIEFDSFVAALLAKSTGHFIFNFIIQQFNQAHDAWKIMSVYERSSRKQQIALALPDMSVAFFAKNHQLLFNLFDLATLVRRVSKPELALEGPCNTFNKTICDALEADIIIARDFVDAVNLLPSKEKEFLAKKSIAWVEKNKLQKDPQYQVMMDRFKIVGVSILMSGFALHILNDSPILSTLILLTATALLRQAVGNNLDNTQPPPRPNL